MFVYLLSLMLFLCVGIIIILSIYLGINTISYDTTKKEQLCTTATCVEKGKQKFYTYFKTLVCTLICLMWFEASSMLKNLDESVDPCEDFYQFSCGNFNKNNRLDDSQNKISEFSMLRDEVTLVLSDLLAEPITNKDISAIANAKNLYASCLNEGKYYNSFFNSLLTYKYLIKIKYLVNLKSFVSKKSFFDFFNTKSRIN